MKFIKHKEIRLLHSPVIEMRKSSRKLYWWTIAALLIITLMLILVFKI